MLLHIIDTPVYSLEGKPTGCEDTTLLLTINLPLLIINLCLFIPVFIPYFQGHHLPYLFTYYRSLIRAYKHPHVLHVLTKPIGNLSGLHK